MKAQKNSISVRRWVSILLIVCLSWTSMPAYAEPRSEATDFEIKISPQIGHVEETYRGNLNRHLILIQDAHDNPDAQKNIAELIHGFVDSGRVKTVFEEGYEGLVPTDFYFGSVSRELRLSAGKVLMDHLRLSGAEYAHLMRKKHFELIGADHMGLYEANLMDYRSAIQVLPSIERELRAYEMPLENEILRNANSEARSWWRDHERYQNGELTLPDYLLRIDRRHQKIIARYPGLLKLMHLLKSHGMAESGIIDFRQILTEISNLNSDLVEYFLGKEKTQDFELFDHIQMLKKLSRLQMNSEEFMLLRSDLDSVKTAHIAQVLSQRTGKPILLSRKWEKQTRYAFKFYDNVMARDRSMLEAILHRAEKSDDREFVLVVGGFHRRHLTELFSREGWHISVVTPGIHELSPRHQNLYIQLMSGGETPFERQLLTNALVQERIYNLPDGFELAHRLVLAQQRSEIRVGPFEVPDKAWQDFAGDSAGDSELISGMALAAEQLQRIGRGLTEFLRMLKAGKAIAPKEERIYSLKIPDHSLLKPFQAWLNEQGSAPTAMDVDASQIEHATYFLQNGTKTKSQVSISNYGHARVRLVPVYTGSLDRYAIAVYALGEGEPQWVASRVIKEDGRYLNPPFEIQPGTVTQVIGDGDDEESEAATGEKSVALLRGNLIERVTHLILLALNGSEVAYEPAFIAEPLSAAPLYPDFVWRRGIYDAKRGLAVKDIRSTIMKYTLLKQLHPDAFDAAQPIRILALDTSAAQKMKIHGYEQGKDFEIISIQSLMDQWEEAIEVLGFKKSDIQTLLDQISSMESRELETKIADFDSKLPKRNQKTKRNYQKPAERRAAYVTKTLTTLEQDSVGFEEYLRSLIARLESHTQKRPLYTDKHLIEMSAVVSDLLNRVDIAKFNAIHQALTRISEMIVAEISSTGGIRRSSATSKAATPVGEEVVVANDADPADLPAPQNATAVVLLSPGKPTITSPDSLPPAVISPRNTSSETEASFADENAAAQEIYRQVIAKMFYQVDGKVVDGYLGLISSFQAAVLKAKLNSDQQTLRAEIITLFDKWTQAGKALKVGQFQGLVSIMNFINYHSEIISLLQRHNIESAEIADALNAFDAIEFGFQLLESPAMQQRAVVRVLWEDKNREMIGLVSMDGKEAFVPDDKGVYRNVHNPQNFIAFQNNYPPGDFFARGPQMPEFSEGIFRKLKIRGVKPVFLITEKREDPRWMIADLASIGVEQNDHVAEATVRLVRSLSQDAGGNSAKLEAAARAFVEKAYAERIPFDQFRAEWTPLVQAMQAVVKKLMLASEFEPVKRLLRRVDEKNGVSNQELSEIFTQFLIFIKSIQVKLEPNESFVHFSALLGRLKQKRKVETGLYPWSFRMNESKFEILMLIDAANNLFAAGNFNDEDGSGSLKFVGGDGTIIGDHSQTDVAPKAADSSLQGFLEWVRSKNFKVIGQFQNSERHELKVYTADEFVRFMVERGLKEPSLEYSALKAAELFYAERVIKGDVGPYSTIERTLRQLIKSVKTVQNGKYHKQLQKYLRSLESRQLTRGELDELISELLLLKVALPATMLRASQGAGQPTIDEAISILVVFAGEESTKDGWAAYPIHLSGSDGPRFAITGLATADGDLLVADGRGISSTGIRFSGSKQTIEIKNSSASFGDNSQSSGMFVQMIVQARQNSMKVVVRDFSSGKPEMKLMSPEAFTVFMMNTMGLPADFENLIKHQIRDGLVRAEVYKRYFEDQNFFVGLGAKLNSIFSNFIVTHGGQSQSQTNFKETLSRIFGGIDFQQVMSAEEFYRLAFVLQALMRENPDGILKDEHFGGLIHSLRQAISSYESRLMMPGFHARTGNQQMPHFSLILALVDADGKIYYPAGGANSSYVSADSKRIDYSKIMRGINGDTTRQFKDSLSALSAAGYRVVWGELEKGHPVRERMHFYERESVAQGQEDQIKAEAFKRIFVDQQIDAGIWDQIKAFVAANSVYKDVLEKFIGTIPYAKPENLSDTEWFYFFTNVLRLRIETFKEVFQSPAGQSARSVFLQLGNLLEPTQKSLSQPAVFSGIPTDNALENPDQSEVDMVLALIDAQGEVYYRTPQDDRSYVSAGGKSADLVEMLGISQGVIPAGINGVIRAVHSHGYRVVWGKLSKNGSIRDNIQISELKSKRSSEIDEGEEVNSAAAYDAQASEPIFKPAVKISERMLDVAVQLSDGVLLDRFIDAQYSADEWMSYLNALEDEMLGDGHPLAEDWKKMIAFMRRKLTSGKTDFDFLSMGFMTSFLSLLQNYQFGADSKMALFLPALEFKAKKHPFGRSEKTEVMPPMMTTTSPVMVSMVLGFQKNANIYAPDLLRPDVFTGEADDVFLSTLGINKPISLAEFRSKLKQHGYTVVEARFLIGEGKCEIVAVMPDGKEEKLMDYLITEETEVIAPHKKQDDGKDAEVLKKMSSALLKFFVGESQNPEPIEIDFERLDQNQNLSDFEVKQRDLLQQSLEFVMRKTVLFFKSRQPIDINGEYMMHVVYVHYLRSLVKVMPSLMEKARAILSSENDKYAHYFIERILGFNTQKRMYATGTTWRDQSRSLEGVRTMRAEFNAYQAEFSHPQEYEVFLKAAEQYWAVKEEAEKNSSEKPLLKTVRLQPSVDVDAYMKSALKNADQKRTLVVAAGGKQHAEALELGGFQSILRNALQRSDVTFSFWGYTESNRVFHAEFKTPIRLPDGRDVTSLSLKLEKTNAEGKPGTWQDLISRAYSRYLSSLMTVINGKSKISSAEKNLLDALQDMIQKGLKEDSLSKITIVDESDYYSWILNEETGVSAFTQLFLNDQSDPHLISLGDYQQAAEQYAKKLALKNELQAQEELWKRQDALHSLFPVLFTAIDQHFKKLKPAEERIVDPSQMLEALAKANQLLAGPSLDQSAVEAWQQARSEMRVAGNASAALSQGDAVKKLKAMAVDKSVDAISVKENSFVEAAIRRFTEMPEITLEDLMKKAGARFPGTLRKELLKQTKGESLKNWLIHEAGMALAAEQIMAVSMPDDWEKKLTVSDQDYLAGWISKDGKVFILKRFLDYLNEIENSAEREKFLAAYLARLILLRRLHALSVEAKADLKAAKTPMLQVAGELEKAVYFSDLNGVEAMPDRLKGFLYYLHWERGEKIKSQALPKLDWGAPVRITQSLIARLTAIHSKWVLEGKVHAEDMKSFEKMMTEYTTGLQYQNKILSQINGKDLNWLEERFKNAQARYISLKSQIATSVRKLREEKISEADHEKRLIRLNAASHGALNMLIVLGFAIVHEKWQARRTIRGDLAELLKNLESKERELKWSHVHARQKEGVTTVFVRNAADDYLHIKEIKSLIDAKLKDGSIKRREIRWLPENTYYLATIKHLLESYLAGENPLASDPVSSKVWIANFLKRAKVNNLPSDLTQISIDDLSAQFFIHQKTFEEMLLKLKEMAQKRYSEKKEQRVQEWLNVVRGILPDEATQQDQLKKIRYRNLFNFFRSRDHVLETYDREYRKAWEAIGYLEDAQSQIRNYKNEKPQAYALRTVRRDLMQVGAWVRLASVTEKTRVRHLIDQAGQHAALAQYQPAMDLMRKAQGILTEEFLVRIGRISKYIAKHKESFRAELDRPVAGLIRSYRINSRRDFRKAFTDFKRFKTRYLDGYVTSTEEPGYRRAKSRATRIMAGFEQVFAERGVPDRAIYVNLLMDLYRLREDVNQKYLKVSDIPQNEMQEIDRQIKFRVQKDLSQRSELRTVAQVSESEFANAQDQAVFIINRHVLEGLTAQQYRELLAHRMAQGQKLVLVITGGIRESARIDELAQTGRIYTEMDQRYLPAKAIKVEFKPESFESFSSLNRDIYSDVYDGAFGVALLYAFQNGKLEGVFKNKKGYMAGDLSRWAIASLSFQAEAFSVFARAA